MQTIVTPGWEIAEDISISSGVFSLPLSSTNNQIMKVVVPIGARAYIESLTARVVDAGSDQVTFFVLRNGMSIAPGFTSIPGVLFDFTQSFALDRDTPPGDIIVFGNNTAAGAIRVVAALKIFLLRRADNVERKGLHQRYTYGETQFIQK